METTRGFIALVFLTSVSAFVTLLSGSVSAGTAGAAPPAAASPWALSELPLDVEAEPWPGPLLQQGHRPEPAAAWAEREDRELERLSRALGLSAEQRLAVVKLLAQERVQAEALRVRRAETRQKLARALEATKPLPAVVGALVIEAHALRQEAGAAGDANEKALRALLTPAQQVTFDALPNGFPPRDVLAREHGPRPSPMGYLRLPMACGLEPAGCAGGPPPMGPPPLPLSGRGPSGASPADGPPDDDGRP